MPQTGPGGLPLALRLSEGLGITREPASVKVFLSDCSIKAANPNRPKLLWLEVSCVDSNAIVAQRAYWFPVSDAPTPLAPHELQSLWSPRVGFSPIRLCYDFNLTLLKVGPERSIATTDGAITVRHCLRLPWNFDGH